MPLDKFLEPDITAKVIEGAYVEVREKKNGRISSVARWMMRPNNYDYLTVWQKGEIQEAERQRRAAGETF